MIFINVYNNITDKNRYIGVRIFSLFCFLLQTTAFCFLCTLCHTDIMSAPSSAFRIGDIPYFDGSLPGSLSRHVKSVLDLLSLDVKELSNPMSIRPFVEGDILVPKDKDTILYLAHVFLLLSGWNCKEVNGRRDRDNGVPVGEKWFVCEDNENCPFLIELRDVQSSRIHTARWCWWKSVVITSIVVIHRSAVV